MRRYDVVFVATPALGNLVPTVEFARRLVDHDPRFSATVLVITMPQRPIIEAYLQARATSSADSNLRFLCLPPADPPAPEQYHSSIACISLTFQNHKSHVKEALVQLMTRKRDRLAGFFVDMFSTSLIEVSAELDIPCYLFFASPASYLGFMLHLGQLGDEFTDSESEFAVPSFKNPLPSAVLPNAVLERGDSLSWCQYHARRYKEVKGIVVNTLTELETHALVSLSVSDPPMPSIYPIGPALDLIGPVQLYGEGAQAHLEGIVKWLDDQPPSSVVLLCFGSMGSFAPDQVKEIAIGLERSGFRFIWALREPPKAQLDLPSDYQNPNEVLPEGFLDRTAKVGLVLGWAPQVNILAHKATGGFVSHCGWNSILESLWYGVPIATWPIYAEQQMNAFQMVKELELGVEIRLDYRGGSDLVRAEEVERGIRCLMEGGDEMKNRVKMMSEKCRMAVTKNGSSQKSRESLVEKLMAGI